MAISLSGSGSMMYAEIVLADLLKVDTGHSPKKKT